MVKREDLRKQVFAYQDAFREAVVPAETQGQTDGTAVHSQHVACEAREAALVALNACMA